MDNFFTLSNINSSYKITFIEKVIPLLLVILILFIIYKKRDKIRTTTLLDKNSRYSIGIISAVFLSLYYILEWSANGLTLQNLPLHICFISNILCIILCFTKNKSTYNFVIFTGVLGGLSSLLAPDLSLSFRYFRYYQFMICHGSIIIIPLYFLFIYKYHIAFKDVLKVLLTTEVLGISLGIFNELFNTSYMFVSFTSNKAAEDTILFYIGEGYTYFINLQLLFIVVMLLWYLILKCIFKIIK